MTPQLIFGTASFGMEYASFKDEAAVSPLLSSLITDCAWGSAENIIPANTFLTRCNWCSEVSKSSGFLFEFGDRELHV